MHLRRAALGSSRLARRAHFFFFFFFRGMSRACDGGKVVEFLVAAVPFFHRATPIERDVRRGWEPCDITDSVSSLSPADAAAKRPLWPHETRLERQQVG